MFRYFMQIVSNGDNLHEISKSVFWENKKKYHQFFACWISPESGKGYTFVTEFTECLLESPEYELFLLWSFEIDDCVCFSWLSLLLRLS